jgi:DNA primase
VRELGERVTARGADGRAHVAQLARPLLEQVPDGLYRRLLIERLAQSFGFQRPAADTAALLDIDLAERRAVGERKAASAGRGSLVRQAIRLLLHFPQLAVDLEPARIGALAPVEEPGVPLLRALIAELREHPAASTGQVLERWRELPDGEHLARLATTEALVPSAEAAGRELGEALDKLAQEAGRRRLDQLLEKDRQSGLSSEEKQQLQELTTHLARARVSSAMR